MESTGGALATAMQSVSAVPFAPWRSWAGPRAAIPLCTDKIKLTLDLVPSVAANAAVNRDDTLRRSGDGAPLATHFVTSDGQAEGSDEQLLDQSLTADPQDIVEHLAATLTTGVAPPPAPSCSVSTDEATQPPTPSSQASSSISASPSTPATSTAESVKAVLSHSASVDPTPLFEQHLEPPGPPAPPKQYPPYVRSPSPSESTSDPSAAELAWARPSRTLAPKEEGQPYTTSDEFKADQYPYSNTSLYQDYGDATLKSTTSIFHFGSFPAGPSTLSHDRPRFHHDESTSLDPSYGYQTTLEEIERAKVLAAAEEERILRLEARVHARRARNLALNPQPIKAPAPVVIEAAPRVSRIVKPTAKAQALMKRPSRQSRLPQPRPLKNVAQYSRFKRTLATSLFPDHIHQDRQFDFSNIPGLVDLFALPPEYIPDPNPPPPPPPTALAPTAASEIGSLQVDTDVVVEPSPSMLTAPLMSKSTSASASTSVFDSPATNRFLDVVGSPRVGLITDDTPDLASPAIKASLPLPSSAKATKQHDIPVVPPPVSTQAQIPHWIHELEAAPGLDDWATSTPIDEQYAMEPALPPQQPLITPFRVEPLPVELKPTPSPADLPSFLATPQAPNDLGLYNLSPSHDPTFRNAEASTSALPLENNVERSPAPTASTSKASKPKKPRAAAAAKRARAADDEPGKRRKKSKEAPGVLIKVDDDPDTPTGFYSLQSTNCISKRCDGATKCFECIARTMGRGCCFEGIRSFGADAEGSHVEPGKIRNTIEEDDLPYFGQPLSSVYTRQHGEWIRTTVAPHLETVLQRELLHACNPATKRIRNDLKKTHTCDTCLHSSLAGDWICNTCGRSSCHQCRSELIELGRKEQEGGATGAAIALASQTVKQQRRKKCIGKKRGTANGAECHGAESFTPLTWIDKEALAVQLAAVKAWSLSHPVMRPVQVVPPSSFARFSPPYPILPSERPVLFVPVTELTESFFHQLWEQPEPLVIDHINLQSIGAWTPQYFASQFIDFKCDLINTKSQEVAPSLLSYFFGMYGQTKPDSRSWKLKGFPDNGFHQLPEMRRAYLEAVPLGDLLRPDGPLNLLSHCLSNTVQPDIGPRAQFCWASRGTTMLHMEVTDVMNLMTFSSGTASGASGSARYDVFRPQDAEVIRAFLFEQLAKKMHKGLSAAKYRETHDDPLLAENVYLDPSLRHELFTRHGIRPFVFWQKSGQFVLIPAGCPYQVTNLDDCLNIAHSFMSRESLGRSLEVYSHSRQETKERSLWRVDGIQLERQLHFSWLSVDDLENPAPPTAPAPVKRSRKIVQPKVDDVDWEP